MTISQPFHQYDGETRFVSLIPVFCQQNNIRINIKILHLSLVQNDVALKNISYHTDFVNVLNVIIWRTILST